MCSPLALTLGMFSIDHKVREKTLPFLAPTTASFLSVLGVFTVITVAVPFHYRLLNLVRPRLGFQSVILFLLMLMRIPLRSIKERLDYSVLPPHSNTAVARNLLPQCWYEATPGAHENTVGNPTGSCEQSTKDSHSEQSSFDIVEPSSSDESGLTASVAHDSQIPNQSELLDGVGTEDISQLQSLRPLNPSVEDIISDTEGSSSDTGSAIGHGQPQFDYEVFTSQTPSVAGTSARPSGLFSRTTSTQPILPTHSQSGSAVGPPPTSPPTPRNGHRRTQRPELRLRPEVQDLRLAGDGEFIYACVGGKVFCEVLEFDARKYATDDDFILALYNRCVETVGWFHLLVTMSTCDRVFLKQV